MPAKKKAGTIVTFKNGAKAKVQANGRYKIISGPTKGRGAKKKGGSVGVAGSVRVAGGMKKKKGGGMHHKY